MNLTQTAMMAIVGGVVGGVIAIIYLGIKAAIKAFGKPKDQN